MADSKISALPASTTPLAGTEVLPIVQSSATKQVSVANLTLGRALGATSIQFGSGTVLSSYEEGLWTPTVFHNGVQITSLGAASGRYIKIGKMVYIAGYANKTTAPDLATGTWQMLNLPFTFKLIVTFAPVNAACFF